MTKKIIIPYFPKGLKYITPVFGGVGIWLIFIQHPVWGILLMLLAAIILTTNYVTEINLSDKWYSDYISMVSLKLNVEKSQFKHLNRIVVTKGNYAQTINTRVQSRQMEWTDFTGTLIMDGNVALDLLTRTDKQELMKELKAYSAFLQVDVEDRTTGKHYIVDMRQV